MEITSLLLDLNYKFDLIGASLLALAKSIYYIFCMLFLLIQGIWVYQLDNPRGMLGAGWSGLQAFRMFLQHIKWVVRPVNPEKVWSIDCLFFCKTGSKQKRLVLIP